MKTSILIPAFLFIALFVSSCDKEPIEINSGQVLLRIENATDFDFDYVLGYEHNFGKIKSGKITKYVPFDWIYQWPQVTVKYDGTVESWTSPIDNIAFWGQRFEQGKFTLRIDAVGQEGLTPIEVTFSQE